VFLKEYVVAKKFKDLSQKRKMVVWNNIEELEQQLNEIEIDKKGMLYTTAELQIFDTTVEEVKELCNGLSGLNNIQKKLKKEWKKVFEHFNEIVLDYDSTLSDKKDTIVSNDYLTSGKLWFNFHLNFLTELLTAFEFLYVKKIIISKYNDFNDIANFQVKLWFHNNVRGNIDIEAFRNKIMKQGLYDESLNSASQLRPYKIGRNLKRNDDKNSELNINNIKVEELDFFQSNFYSNMENTNFKKVDTSLLEEVYSVSIANYNKGIKILDKSKENQKKYYKSFLWRQITFNKKELLKENIIKQIEITEMKKAFVSLAMKIKESNNKILDILENNNNNNELINWIWNKIKKTQDILKTFYNYITLKNFNLTELEIKENILYWYKDLKQDVIKDIISIIKEYKTFYKTTLKNYKKEIQKEVQKVNNLLDNNQRKNKTKNEKANMNKEIFTLSEKYNVEIPKSTFYDIISRDDNILLFNSKSLSFSKVYKTIFKNLTEIVTNENKNKYLENEQIANFIEYFKNLIQKEIQKTIIKKTNNKTLTEYVMLNSYISRAEDIVEKLVEKLSKKNKLTWEKFNNNILNEIPWLFEALYGMKSVVSKSFKVSYWTIKNTYKKLSEVFNKIAEGKTNKTTKKNTNKNKKQSYNSAEISEKIKNSIKYNLQTNANANFFTWKRYNSIVYTIGYIKAVAEKFRNEWNTETANAILSLLDNLESIFWASKLQDFCDEHKTFNLQALIL